MAVLIQLKTSIISKRLRDFCFFFFFFSILLYERDEEEKHECEMAYTHD